MNEAELTKEHNDQPANQVEFNTPDNVKYIYNDQTKETVVDMQPESRRFFSKLAERITARPKEFIQNTVDRVKIYANEKWPVSRAGSKVDALKIHKEQQIKNVQELGRTVVENQKKLDSAKELYASIDAPEAKIDPAIIAREQADIDQMKELIDTAQTRELQFQGQIANAEEELKRYENKTEQFKLNITGRLDAKIGRAHV